MNLSLYLSLFLFSLSLVDRWRVKLVPLGRELLPGNRDALIVIETYVRPWGLGRDAAAPRALFATVETRTHGLLN